MSDAQQILLGKADVNFLLEALDSHVKANGLQVALNAGRMGEYLAGAWGIDKEESKELVTEGVESTD